MSDRYELSFHGGHTVSVELPEARPTPSCYAFSLHKAGSSLLAGVLTAYCREVGIQAVDVSDSASGVPILSVDPSSLAALLGREGYVHVGWRTYPSLPGGFSLGASKVVFLVRDPRDRLVSQYFSFGRSHRIPQAGPAREDALALRQTIRQRSIDENALAMVGWIIRHWHSYHTRLDPAHTRIYRYEDVIFRKAEWLTDMVHFLELPFDKAAVQRVVAVSDIRPTKEDPDAHVRQVAPGNHLKHLRPATIERLGRKFALFMEAYDYHRPEEFGREVVFAAEGEAAKRVLRARLGVRRRLSLWLADLRDRVDDVLARVAGSGGYGEEEVYDSDIRPPAFVDEAVQLLRYRSLIAELVARDIKIRYKRSILGVAWTLLNPLGTMLVIVFVFQNLFQRAVENYPVYLLSGILAWQFFTTTTTHSSSQLVWGGALLHRIYLPKAVFAVSAAGTALVNLLISIVPLAAVMALSGAALTPSLWGLPFAILFLAMFSLGVGLALSAFAVFFVDVLNMYAIILTMWMYLTPIFYPPDILPEAFQWVLRVNPMYHLVQLFRSPVHAGIPAAVESWITAAAVSVGALAVGWWLFTRQADEYAYRV